MNRLLHKLKQQLRGLSIALMRWVIKQPLLKAVALFILTKLPHAKAYLNDIALSGGLSTRQHSEVTLSEFNSELGRISSTNHSTVKVTDSQYFASNTAPKLCQAYSLNFDFELIEKIRSGEIINYQEYSGENLKLSIAHFYLALLYRFPSTQEIEQCSKKVITHQSFASLIKTIKELPEYQERGRKKVVS